MLATLREIITNQYEASLRTIDRCLELCPDDLWDAPVVRYPFSQTAFHTLFFADYYLEPSPESFREQAYHREHEEFFGDYEQMQDREPVSLYDRSDLRDYLQYCRQKAIDTIASESVEELASPARFPRRSFSRAELHLYNMRHIQHHAGQLIMRLRLHGDFDIPWYGSGWGDARRAT